MEDMCTHLASRLLWSDPHDSKGAYIEFLVENNIIDEDFSGLKEFFDRFNITICVICGEKVE